MSCVVFYDPDDLEGDDFGYDEGGVINGDWSGDGTEGWEASDGNGDSWGGDGGEEDGENADQEGWAWGEETEGMVEGDSDHGSETSGDGASEGDESGMDSDGSE